MTRMAAPTSSLVDMSVMDSTTVMPSEQGALGSHPLLTMYCITSFTATIVCSSIGEYYKLNSRNQIWGFGVLGFWVTRAGPVRPSRLWRRSAARSVGGVQAIAQCPAVGDINL